MCHTSGAASVSVSVYASVCVCVCVCVEVLSSFIRYVSLALYMLLLFFIGFFCSL